MGEPVENTRTEGGDQVFDRRAKLDRLRDEFGIDPFGQRTAGLVSLAEARAAYCADADAAFKADASRDERPIVQIAGRVVLHRDIGKLVFMTLRDASDEGLQVAVSMKSVDEQSFKLAKLADLGDIVIARGRLGTTKTGEVTVWAGGMGKGLATSDEGLGKSAEPESPVPSPQSPAFTIATKSLAPPPGKWEGLSDPELRYRKRYVDLWANPHVMRTMMLRTRIIEEIRQYLRGRGYVEVETPMMQTLAGGAAARPFTTKHNALDIQLYLRIAPELYLKRLLVGGFNKVFEINRNFRNEGMSPRHNPEFTMLEAYEAFGSWETMADMVEEMICTVAEKVFGTLIIEHKDEEGNVTKTINLTRPWRRVSMVELVEERTGWTFVRKSLTRQEALVFSEVLLRRGEEQDLEELTFYAVGGGRLNLKEVFKGIGDAIIPTDEERAALETVADIKRREEINQGASRLQALSPAEQLVEVYEKLIEHTLIDPTFVTHVPSVVIPLARENKQDPFFADVYELAINGQEISPGYSELNDPDVQERHFRHQVGDKDEQQKVDEDFLEALRVGMPPAGGMGLGIDRLVMMLTGAESIRDVILFPLMKPREGGS